jgi:RimJ/RimL family protein N-acetyltransferase
VAVTKGGEPLVFWGAVDLHRYNKYKGLDFEVAGDKVRLRAITERDLAKLVEWDEDEEISRWAGKKFSCRDEAREWYLEKPLLNKRTLAIETLGGEFIGEIEILNVSWRLHTGELRVVIGEKDYWNRGIGTDAVFAFVKWIFRNYSINTIYLRVDKENHRARRCYTKVGFRPVGKVRFSPDRSVSPAHISGRGIAATRVSGSSGSGSGPSTHLILMELSREEFFEGLFSADS